MRSVTEEQRRQQPRQGLARRVADLCRCRGVARRSKIHEGYSPSSCLAAAPNLLQRTRSLFMRWVLGAAGLISFCVGGRFLPEARFGSAEFRTGGCIGGAICDRFFLQMSGSRIRLEV